MFRYDLGASRGLNPSQQAALAAATSRRLTLVQGPPGTGKTQARGDACRSPTHVILSLVCTHAVFWLLVHTPVVDPTRRCGAHTKPHQTTHKCTHARTHAHTYARTARWWLPCHATIICLLFTSTLRHTMANRSLYGFCSIGCAAGVMRRRRAGPAGVSWHVRTQTLPSTTS